MEQTDAAKRRYLTLDIGGTKISGALWEDGALIEASFRSAPSGAAEGEEAVYTNIKMLLEDVISCAPQQNICGIGVGCPGPLDRKSGRIIHAPLMGWRNFPIVRRLVEDFKLPVRLDRDGNLGALAEVRLGAAQGLHNIVYMTVSTGCGAGIIINGDIYRGAEDGAGEIGHISIDPEGPPCPCGSRGCFELYASGTALINMMKRDLELGKKSLVFDLAGYKKEKLSGKALDEAAGAGDEYALNLYRKEGYYLGVGIANIFNMLAPQALVLGGGITKGRKFFHQVMIETLKERCEHNIAEDSIRYSFLNDRVVLYGAYILISENL